MSVIRTLVLFAVAAVLRNPWAGRGYVEDLRPEIRDIAPQLGIAVDVTHATDCPTIDQNQYGQVKLGKGPVLYRGPNVNPVVLQRLRDVEVVALVDPATERAQKLARKYGVAIEPRMVANRIVIVVDKHGKVAWIQPTEKITDIPDYDPVLACSKD